MAAFTHPEKNAGQPYEAIEACLDRRALIFTVVDHQLNFDGITAIVSVFLSPIVDAAAALSSSKKSAGILLNMFHGPLCIEGPLAKCRWSASHLFGDQATLSVLEVFDSLESKPALPGAPLG